MSSAEVQPVKSVWQTDSGGGVSRLQALNKAHASIHLFMIAQKQNEVAYCFDSVLLNLSASSNIYITALCKKKIKKNISHSIKAPFFLRAAF